MKTKKAKKKYYGLKSLSKKQRILFNEYWNANRAFYKGKHKSDYVRAWHDGFVCGKFSKNWER